MAVYIHLSAQGYVNGASVSAVLVSVVCGRPALPTGEGALMRYPELHRFATPTAMAQELFPSERGRVDAAAPGEVAFGAVVAVFDGIARHAE